MKMMNLRTILTISAVWEGNDLVPKQAGAMR